MWVDLLEFKVHNPWKVTGGPGPDMFLSGECVHWGMKKGTALALAILLIVLPLGFAAWLHPRLPGRIPVHFGADGRPDAWGGPDSIYLGPSIMGAVSLILFAMLTNLGRIDPKRHSTTHPVLMRSFAVYLTGFLSLLSGCMLASMAWEGLPVLRLLLGALGLGISGMGLFLPRLEPNYFTGYRLPWTLEDPGNWASTHRLAGRLWTWGGLVIALAALLLEGRWLLWAFTLSMAVTGLAPVVHSWRRFRRAGR